MAEVTGFGSTLQQVHMFFITAYCFIASNNNMQYLDADIHQDSFGENARMQCTAIALAALLLTWLVLVDQWNIGKLSDVIFTENGIYSGVIRTPLWRQVVQGLHW